MVVVGSGNHRDAPEGGIQFDDLSGAGWYRRGYSHSKLANGLFSFELARRLAGTGATSLADGVRQLADGAGQLAENAPALRQGATDLSDGLAQLQTGSAELTDGATQVADGTQQLYDTVVPGLDRVIERQDAVAADVAAVDEDVQRVAEVAGTAEDGAGARIADAQAALVRLDPVQVQAGDVHQGVEGHHFQLHQVQQVGAARNDRGASGHIGHRVGAKIGEFPHAASSR